MDSLLDHQDAALESSIVLQGYLNDAEHCDALSRAAKALNLTANIRKGDVWKASRDLDGARSPTLLIVDLSGTDREMSAMEELARVCEPSARVIAVGGRNDIGLYRGLKAIGVIDYLYKPVAEEQFRLALREAIGQAPAKSTYRLGKVVSVVGARGGTGATTLSVNLASYLAEKVGRRVALVDLDLTSGTSHLLLNASLNTGLVDALDNIDRVDSKFLERAMISVSDKHHLLGSNGQKVPSRGLNAEGLHPIIDYAQSIYHFTVLDVPSAAASTDASLLSLSNVCYLICDGGLTSVYSAAKLYSLAASVCPTVYIVLNRAGAPGQLSEAEIERILGRPPDLSVPFLPRQLTDAAISGVPAIASSRRMASAVSGLAWKITGRPVSRLSLADRIFRR